MNKQHLDKITAWFNTWVDAFYGSDQFANSNWKMKELHSRRVCGEAVRLARALALNPEQILLARLLGLLHDVGRFEQFAVYHTYNDAASTPHGPLGAQILRRENVLADLSETERDLILTAIDYHAVKTIPDDLEGDRLLFARLIRDADKTDVYRVVTGFYHRYKADPENFELEIDLPDKPTFSAELVENILARRQTDYRRLTTLNDLIILQLGWVYDINFRPTLERIRQLGFLEKMISFLPDAPQLKTLARAILDHRDAAINADNPPC